MSESEEQVGAKKLQIGKRREPSQMQGSYQAGQQRHQGEQPTSRQDGETSHQDGDTSRQDGHPEGESPNEKICVKNDLTENNLEKRIGDALLEDKLSKTLIEMEVDLNDQDMQNETVPILVDMECDELEENEQSNTSANDVPTARTRDTKTTAKARDKKIIPVCTKGKTTNSKAKKTARENVPVTEPETGTINEPVIEVVNEPVIEVEEESSEATIERTLALLDKQDEEHETRKKTKVARKLKTRKNNLKNKGKETGATKQEETAQQEETKIEMPSSSNQPPNMVEQQEDKAAVLQNLIDEINEATRAKDIDFTEQLRRERLREREDFPLSDNLEEDDHEREYEIELEYEKLNAFNLRQQKRPAEGENPDATEKKRERREKSTEDNNLFDDILPDMDDDCESQAERDE